MHVKFLAIVLLLAGGLAGTAQAQVKKNPPPKKKTAITKKPVKKTTAAKPQAPKENFTRLKISTTLGDIVVRLYNKTPLHRDNYIKLVKENFFDSLLFHRVINGFMIQGGDPGSKTAPSGEMLGMGDIGYTIPAEFDTTIIHKRGALCAARTQNPEKASSACQFYIVQGRKISDGELDALAAQRGIAYTPAQRMTYKMNGGTPFLDMDYTVFGEVETGMEVVDAIATQPRDGANRPLTDVRMKITLLEKPVAAPIK
jgi:cyclophilin family peptidyl-prolyl cis-trans isomerase